jgi:glycyl-tRNA synthetase beta subunit
MKTVKFVPKLCTDWTDDDGVVHAAKFKGFITLRVPNFFERQKIKTILMSAVTSGGETDIDSIKEASKKVDVIELMKKMASVVEESVPFYTSVDLENIKSGAVHKSFDDLSCDSDAESILQEVAQEIANGFSLSKNS